MTVRTLLVAGLLLVSRVALGAEYAVEPLKEAPPAKAFPPAIEKLVASQGVRVMKGTKPLCDIWLAQKWAVQADFKPSGPVLYPFKVGDLMGVVRYHSKAADFRNQDIPAGNYTLRYAQQPVDGNHLGTSDTRDFLLLIPAAQDADPKPLPEMTMFLLSPKTSGGTHPAMLSMLKSEGSASPALKHDVDRELWSVRVAGQSAEAKPLVIEFVVVGHAPE